MLLLAAEELSDFLEEEESLLLSLEVLTELLSEALRPLARRFLSLLVAGLSSDTVCRVVVHVVVRFDDRV